MTPSLARGTEANYVAQERPCCRLADVVTRTQPEAIAPQSDTPGRRCGAGKALLADRLLYGIELFEKLGSQGDSGSR